MWQNYRQMLLPWPSQGQLALLLPLVMEPISMILLIRTMVEGTLYCMQGFIWKRGRDPSLNMNLSPKNMKQLQIQNPQSYIHLAYTHLLPSNNPCMTLWCLHDSVIMCACTCETVTRIQLEARQQPVLIDFPSHNM